MAVSKNPFRKNGKEPLGGINCSQITRWTTLTLGRIFTDDSKSFTNQRIFTDDSKSFTNPFRCIIKWGEVELLLERIQLPLPTIFLGVYYLDAFKLRCIKCDILEKLNLVHHLLPLGLMIAMKFLDDSPYSTHYWATLMGLEIEFVKEIERRFLSIIEFKLYVTKEHLEHWVKFLK